MFAHAKMKIEKHIFELLFDYDCVVVPGLGGFVTNYHPAQIDQRKHLFNPPFKAILFNKHLTQNDGLLAHHVARKANITYDQAVLAVQSYVEEFKTKLNGGSPAEMAGIGAFTLDSEQNIRFEREVNSNFLRSSFGLKSFYATPVGKAEDAIAAVEAKVIPIAVEGNPKNPVDEELTQAAPAGKRVSMWKIAAAACFIPIAFYAVWIPLKTDAMETGTIQISDLNPFSKANYGKYAPRTESKPLAEFSTDPVSEKVFAIKPGSQEVVELDFINKEGVKPIPVDLSSDFAAPVNTYVAPAARKLLRFHVIGGAFAKLRNAERFVKKLRKQGFDAVIIDQKNELHRVCYSSFALRNEAVAALREIQSAENKNAWLLVK